MDDSRHRRGPAVLIQKVPPAPLVDIITRLHSHITRNGSQEHSVRSADMRTTQHPRIGAVPLCARVGEALALLGRAIANTCSDYKDDGTNILLDANENAYGPGLALNGEGKLNGTSAASASIDVDLLGLNRYPDPYAKRPLLSITCSPSTQPPSRPQAAALQSAQHPHPHIEEHRP